MSAAADIVGVEYIQPDYLAVFLRNSRKGLRCEKSICVFVCQTFVLRKCDTLFDALLRAGKKVAIVAVAECSIARIFLERELDYYITASDRESIETAIRLLGEDKYDAITLYNGSYDSTMHRSGVESEAALSVLQQNAVDFDRVVTAAKKVWVGRNALFGWVTDHGAHDDEVSGRGSHGQDIAEDRNVVHFWGTYLPACTPEQ